MAWDRQSHSKRPVIESNPQYQILRHYVTLSERSISFLPFIIITPCSLSLFFFFENRLTDHTFQKLQLRRNLLNYPQLNVLQSKYHRMKTKPDWWLFQSMKNKMQIYSLMKKEKTQKGELSRRKNRKNKFKKKFWPHGKFVHVGLSNNIDRWRLTYFAHDGSIISRFKICVKIRLKGGERTRRIWIRCVFWLGCLGDTEKETRPLRVLEAQVLGWSLREKISLRARVRVLVLVLVDWIVLMKALRVLVLWVWFLLSWWVKLEIELANISTCFVGLFCFYYSMVIWFDHDPGLGTWFGFSTLDSALEGRGSTVHLRSRARAVFPLPHNYSISLPAWLPIEDASIRGNVGWRLRGNWSPRNEFKATFGPVWPFGPSDWFPGLQLPWSRHPMIPWMLVSKAIMLAVYARPHLASNFWINLNRTQ